jgi:hypothetical protein
MKPKIEDTDIIIRQAANGWIVFSGSEYEADHFMTTVYEERESEWGEHEALIHLFREHFPGYIQSKNRGGIRLEVRVKGYVEEDEDWSEYESTIIANTPEQTQEQDEWLEKVMCIEKEAMNKIMTKDDVNEQNNDHYVTKVQEMPNGELFVELPQKLIDQLGWEVDDDVEWEESEMCEDWGEHKGFSLSNKSKLFRDAEEARKKLVSIDME